VALNQQWLNGFTKRIIIAKDAFYNKNNHNNNNTWTIYENHMSSQWFILHMANHLEAHAVRQPVDENCEKAILLFFQNISVLKKLPAG